MYTHISAVNGAQYKRDDELDRNFLSMSDGGELKMVLASAARSQRVDLSDHVRASAMLSNLLQVYAVLHDPAKTAVAALGFRAQFLASYGKACSSAAKVACVRSFVSRFDEIRLRYVGRPYEFGDADLMLQSIQMQLDVVASHVPSTDSPTKKRKRGEHKGDHKGDPARLANADYKRCLSQKYCIPFNKGQCSESTHPHKIVVKAGSTLRDPRSAHTSAVAATPTATARPRARPRPAVSDWPLRRPRRRRHGLRPARVSLEACPIESPCRWLRTRHTPWCSSPLPGPRVSVHASRRRPGSRDPGRRLPRRRWIHRRHTS
jgi:hypothetical protein